VLNLLDHYRVPDSKQKRKKSEFLGPAAKILTV